MEIRRRETNSWDLGKSYIHRYPSTIPHRAFLKEIGASQPPSLVGHPSKTKNVSFCKIFSEKKGLLPGRVLARNNGRAFYSEVKGKSHTEFDSKHNLFSSFVAFFSTTTITS